MKRLHRILLADDESLFAATTADFLREHGYDVSIRSDGLSIAEDVANNPLDLIITDLDMPGNRNLELLSFCRNEHPDIPVIIVTGRPSLPTAIESVRLGIHDYILKPIDLDDLLHSIQRALPRSLAEQEPTLSDEFSEILGSSPATMHMKKQAGRIARSHATVLVRGESGSGKELLARGIHVHSQRRSQPFVTVDCGAIPEPLVESILFGHSKGAFTGAVHERIGLVKTADRGSLFLDEIGELPLLIQAKLLRLLQFGTFIPVGSSKEQSVDIRIIAATHRNLQEEVHQGRFREDLFYRLSVLVIESPALRDRPDDIPELAKHFAAAIAKRDGLQNPKFSAEALSLLQSHPWPGNIRELHNVIERCMCNANSACIEAINVRESIGQAPKQPGRSVSDHQASWEGQSNWEGQSFERFQEEQERRYIDQLLKRHQGNISSAAREANLTRQGLHKIIQRIGISTKEYR